MFARRSMAACSAREVLVLFGGVGAAGTESILDVSNDCWVFDPTAMRWHELPRQGTWPSPRRCVGVCPSPTGLFVWGGSGVAEAPPGPRYTFLNDWWHLDLVSSRWTCLRDSDDHRVSPVTAAPKPYPPPRYTPVFHAAGDELFLFGGYTEDRLGKRKLNDAWIFLNGEWQLVEQPPGAGYGPTATSPGLRYGCMSAISRRTIFVLGGFSDEGDHNDLWQFDLDARRWTLILADSDSSDVPMPRYCSACEHHDGKLYLFGGRSRGNPRANYNDLWTFDLTSARWECLTPNRTPHRYDAAAPFPGYHAKAASAALGDYWYVWGGEGARGHVSDFWRFSFVTGEWQMLQAARADDPIFW